MNTKTADPIQRAVEALRSLSPEARERALLLSRNVPTSVGYYFVGFADRPVNVAIVTIASGPDPFLQARDFAGKWLPVDDEYFTHWGPRIPAWDPGKHADKALVWVTRANALQTECCYEGCECAATNHNAAGQGFCDLHFADATLQDLGAKACADLFDLYSLVPAREPPRGPRVPNKPGSWWRKIDGTSRLVEVLIGVEAGTLLWQCGPLGGTVEPDGHWRGQALPPDWKPEQHEPQTQSVELDEDDRWALDVLRGQCSNATRILHETFQLPSDGLVLDAAFAAANKYRQALERIAELEGKEKVPPRAT